MHGHAKPTRGALPKTVKPMGRRAPVGPAIVVLMLASTWTGLALGAEPATAQAEMPLTVPGLLGEYFHNDNLTEPAFERIDPSPRFIWGTEGPGEGVEGDTFSVRWTGYITAPTTGTYTFYTRSDDGVRLTIAGELILDDWVPRVATYLTQSRSVHLEANVPTEIRLDHYQGAGEGSMLLSWLALGVTYAPVPPSAFSTDAGLLATYHDGQELSGSMLRRVEPTIDHDWGTGAPDPLLGSDGFSVRWTGLVTAPISGEYTFYARSDDGARVRVGDTLVLDDWQDHAAVEDVPSAPVRLIAGKPTPIQVDHYEASGDASMQLKWSGPGIAKEVVPSSALLPAGQPGPIWPAKPGLLAEYFHDNNLSEPAFERIDAAPRFDWSTSDIEHPDLVDYPNWTFRERLENGAPDARLEPDTFSVRWTGHLSVPRPGNYTFYTEADDAARLYIDDQLVIDAWSRAPCCVTAASAALTLDAGLVAIRVDYAEDQGDARIDLKWRGPGVANQTIPSAAFSTDAGLLVTYHNDTELGGPVVRRLETNIDHDWGAGSPDPLIGNDGFSARWTGFITAETSGRYTFYTDGDDGARVAVAGAVVLDDRQPEETHADVPSKTVHLVAGVPTPIQVEHVHASGNASMRLKWSGPWHGIEVVPQHVLTPALEWQTGRPIQIDSGYDYTCALLEVGTVNCWGTIVGSLDVTTGDIVQVDAGLEHFCWLLVTGNIDCFGVGPKSESYTGGDAVQVSAGFEHTCALLTNGNIECWGGPTRPPYYDVDASGDYHGGDAVQVSAGDLITCALLRGGSTTCWGYLEGTSSGSSVLMVAGSYENLCTIDLWRVICREPWGHPYDLFDTRDLAIDLEIGGRFIGESHLCMLLYQGNVDCTGFGRHGQAADYQAGDAAQIAVGAFHNCVLTTSNHINCWGQDDYQLKPHDVPVPAIGESSTMVVEANGPAGAVVDYAAPASDVPVVCAPASGSTFAVGIHSVACSATDPWGNRAMSHFAIEVFADTTPPTTTLQADGPPGDNGWFLGPVNVTLPCADSGWGCASTQYRIDASGWQEGHPSLINKEGTTQIGWYSVDLAGNVEQPQTQVIRVDSEPPMIKPHRDEVHEATGPNGAVVTYVPPLWNDAVAGVGLASCTPRPHSIFPLGNTTVTCTARDPAGNQATPTTFMVSVVDTTPPVIEPKSSFRQHATAFGGANISYEAPRWTDIVDGTGPADCTPARDTFHPMGDTTISCGARDRAGNEAERTTFTITVVAGPVHDVVITPDNVTVNLAQPGAFAADGYDRYGNLNDTVAPQWSTDNGTIDSNGTYIGEHVGFWQVNATMDEATGSVLVSVTDRLRVAVQMEQSQVDSLTALTEGIHGTVEVRLWDHTPQANATVDVVIRQELAGIGVRDTTVRVTTDSGGTAQFRVPEHFVTTGSYVVHAHATWRGNLGHDATGYAVSV